MRRRYIYFLLTYFHNSSKKEHITKCSIKSTINSIEAANLSGPSSDPSARHVLVRPKKNQRYLYSRYVGLYSTEIYGAALRCLLGVVVVRSAAARRR